MSEPFKQELRKIKGACDIGITPDELRQALQKLAAASSGGERENEIIQLYKTSMELMVLVSDPGRNKTGGYFKWFGNQIYPPEKEELDNKYMRAEPQMQKDWAWQTKMVEIVEKYPELAVRRSSKPNKDGFMPYVLDKDNTYQKLWAKAQSLGQ